MRSRCLLYVLGTSHPLQCASAECMPAQVDAFREELRRIFEAHNIRCVAEEMDAEGLRRYDIASTIAQPLALSLYIQHHNVDLTGEERNRFSLGQAARVNVATRVPSKYCGAKFNRGFDSILNEVRERCWVARIPTAEFESAVESPRPPTVTALAVCCPHMIAKNVVQAIRSRREMIPAITEDGRG
jgi:hypothetical protein